MMVVLDDVVVVVGYQPYTEYCSRSTVKDGTKGYWRVVVPTTESDCNLAKSYNRIFLEPTRQVQDLLCFV
jgi:hypothetical protein